MALKWVIQRGHALVTATVNPALVRDDLDIFGWRLTDHEMCVLDSVRSGAPLTSGEVARSRRRPTAVRK